jgi:hypothetical protein
MCCLDLLSSHAVSTAALRLSNRTRTDWIFPIIPGDPYRYISGHFDQYMCCYTSWSCRNLSNEDLNQLAVSQLKGSDDRDKLTVNCATWFCIDCCWDICHHVLTLSKHHNIATYLIDEDSLPKLLDELDNSLRVLCLVKSPCHLPFLQQGLRPLFNVTERPAGDQFRGEIAEYTVQTFPAVHASLLLLDHHWCWCS